MRTKPFPHLLDEEHDAFYEDLGIADGRNTYEALEAFDRLLRPHGLELLLFDGFSEYYFKIVPHE